MPEILALLQNIGPLLEKTTLRQVNQVIFGMLVSSGRITMLGLSRWTEKGGSYRTIQRFYHTVLSWPALHWLFFKESFLHCEDEYIAAGDEVVVSKEAKKPMDWIVFLPGSSSVLFRVYHFLCFRWSISAKNGHTQCGWHKL